MKKKKRRSWKTTLWKTVPCDSGGEDCWCRMVRAETGTLIVGAGDVDKPFAELVVKEHNELLELKKNGRN
ncbi:hypothetical protein LCGC14_1109200 [marine sediment metagenome]|uniref:Uncharacterized protein n=1 Tax=marine sediment metagenome TaxID=412755 RepID=A0A0F9MC36_9ZZZZ